jgi:hypothetical protein
VRADAASEPELFWGLRGAGANFGIATSFELGLHPVGPAVLAGIAVYPIERAREVAAAFTAAMAAAPDEVTAGMGWFVAPPGQPFPPAVAGRPVMVVNATHGGPLPGADRDLAPLRALGPALDTFAPPAVPGPPGRERRPLPLGQAPLLEGPAAGGPGRRGGGPDRGAAGGRPRPRLWGRAAVAGRRLRPGPRGRHRLQRPLGRPVADHRGRRPGRGPRPGRLGP